MYKCPAVAGALYLHGTTKMCVVGVQISKAREKEVESW